MDTCRQCGSWSVAGHNHRKVIGRDPFVHVNKTWALPCPETVHQRPCMTREMETWLSDSRVCNNSVVEHRSRRPVLSPLRNCVDRCHVWPLCWKGLSDWAHIAGRRGSRQLQQSLHCDTMCRVSMQFNCTSVESDDSFWSSHFVDKQLIGSRLRPPVQLISALNSFTRWV